MIRRRRYKGFSLLELSVVIGIISLIAGAGMTIASNALKAADRIGTQEKLNTIKLALDSFGKTYGYLPCPARRDYIPGDASFGVENRNAIPGTSCTAAGGIVSASNTMIGMVPVRTLGLPDSYAGDAWGNKITYAVTHNTGLVGDPTRYATKSGIITIRYGTPIGSWYTQTNQRTNGGTTVTYSSVTSGGDASFTFTGASPAAATLIYLKPNTAAGYSGSYWVKTGANPTKLTTDTPTGTTYLAFNATDTGGVAEWQSSGADAAYAVVSNGPDGKGAYPILGTAVAIACDATQADGANCDDADAIFYDTEYNDGTTAATHFDDYIVWGSNAGFRTAVNPTIYTASTSTCPTGICEAWCATCEYNYPAAGIGTATATAPAATITSATSLCKKVISSATADCKAACFWGGISSVPEYYKCP